MKALLASGWVIASKRATWMYYSIKCDAVERLHQYMVTLTSRKSDSPIRANCDSSTCCEPNPDES
jgi:hypothetical protein